ncbi:MAG: Os1348 family NHLP clan protein [Chloroflexota bacterium]
MGADLQLLVGKILSDEKFAVALAEDPEKTLREAGIEPTIDLLDALQGVDAESLRKLATNFGEHQAAL